MAIRGEAQRLRLARYLAAAGVTSRRKAEALITAGRVKVNGQVIRELGFSVNEESDRVELDGRVVRRERPVYILLNKPRGYLCTLVDTHGRPTVLQLLKGVTERVYPVGRLDYDTEGLLLLTNDGDFAYSMTHPRFEIEKTYEAWVEGRVTRRALEELRDGVFIDGVKTAPAKVRVLVRRRDRTLLEIKIHEGRKRQVKKMCAAVGHPVTSLKRTRIADLALDGLSPGEFRYLTEQEVKHLGAQARGEIKTSES